MSKTPTIWTALNDTQKAKKNKWRPIYTPIRGVALSRLTHQGANGLFRQTFIVTLAYLVVLSCRCTYVSEEATGADGVGEAVPALVGRVLPSHEDVLVAHVVGSLVDDPGPALHPDGVTAADVGAELGAVAAAFVVMALEVPVLVEEDLQGALR